MGTRWGADWSAIRWIPATKPPARRRPRADVAASGAGLVKGVKAPATALLRTAAAIIGLDLGTQALVLDVGGFDTHSDQVNRHPALWADVAGRLHEFLTTMAATGQADRVLVITTSGFGRRVRENDSGTDHGNGGVQFLMGPVVNGGQVVGQADLGVLDQGDLRSIIDARTLYANALDWITADGGVADDVLGDRVDRMGLLNV